MIKIDVPYRSQWADDAKLKSGDCGPTCLAMILNFRGVPMTPNGVYEDVVYEVTDTKRIESGYTDFNQLMNAAKSNNVPMTYRRYETREEAFRNLRATVDAGSPGIALVRYKPWRDIFGNLFDGGHFVVVTGYDDNNIFIHDPLFGNWVGTEAGTHRAVPNDLFNAAWSETFSSDPGMNIGSNYSIAYSGRVVDAGAEPQPQPQPEPKPEPKPEPVPVTPTPVTPVPKPSPTTSLQIMDDVNRRIRALAAYRWAEAPDFGNPAALQIWLDNLGDFGLEYEVYKIKSGDTLAALAARHYDGQNRWPAIKMYNDLPDANMLWLGQPIMIPRVGTGDGHSSDALPSDTAEFSKDLEFLLVDPDLEPLDYNALVGESSMGIGYVDMPDA